MREGLREVSEGVKEEVREERDWTSVVNEVSKVASIQVTQCSETP